MAKMHICNTFEYMCILTYESEIENIAFGRC
jgi:hypothetical protein